VHSYWLVAKKGDCHRLAESGKKVTVTVLGLHEGWLAGKKGDCHHLACIAAG